MIAGEVREVCTDRVKDVVYDRRSRLRRPVGRRVWAVGSGRWVEQVRQLRLKKVEAFAPLCAEWPARLEDRLDVEAVFHGASEHSGRETARRRRVRCRASCRAHPIFTATALGAHRKTTKEGTGLTALPMLPALLMLPELLMLPLIIGQRDGLPV